MANKQWPARGQMSTDEKYYTDHEGRVHEYSPMSEEYACARCSLYALPCSHLNDREPCGFRLIEGAYVPSADERVAEKVMRAMIAMCPGRDKDLNTCHGKGCFDLQTCPLRRYLSDELHDPKAWEVES